MSTAERLRSCFWLCWRTLRSTASLFRVEHRPPASRVIGENEAVFREILDSNGDIQYGEENLGRGSRWHPSWAAIADADKMTLLRGLVQGPGVDVFVGPEHAQYSVSRTLLFHYSTMVRRTFARHGADKRFREFDDNALYFPEHAPETFEFILKWMYQKQLGIAEYCKVVFATNDRSHEGLETAFLLLCRVYTLADYLDMKETMDPVMEDLLETTEAGVEKRQSAIGPDAVKSVWRHTH